MKNNIKFLLLSAILIGFTACNDEEDFEEFLEQPPTDTTLPALTAGSVDFSNYVALGASFTAGYADNALFIAAQESSFPNTLANQFAKVGGGTFTQPLMNDNIGGLIGEFGPRLYFYNDPDPSDGFGSGPYPLGVVPHLLDFTPESPTTTTTNIYNSSSPFNNMGVPGAKSTHINLVGYGSSLGNPYFERMASSPAATMLGDAIAQNPTFFTLSEIGGNDVLGYATTGGDGSDPITPTATFDAKFTDMVNQLTAVSPKGAVTNVPYITDLAHFTTVPHNPIPLDAATAGFLNSVSAYGAYNAGLLQIESAGIITAEEREKRTIVFAEGEGNAVVIMDENLTDLTGINPALVSMRQATAEDLLVLTASSFIGTENTPGDPTTVNGVAVPLEDKWVLLPEEQAEIRTATDAYNATIASVASSKGLALVDLNTVLSEASSSTGVAFDDYRLNTSLVTGGLISLDGIHLTAVGYALMANKFLEAIDNTYGSNFVASENVAKAEDFRFLYPASL